MNFYLNDTEINSLKKITVDVLDYILNTIETVKTVGTDGDKTTRRTEGTAFEVSNDLTETQLNRVYSILLVRISAIPEGSETLTVITPDINEVKNAYRERINEIISSTINERLGLNSITLINLRERHSAVMAINNGTADTVQQSIITNEARIKGITEQLTRDNILQAHVDYCAMVGILEGYRAKYLTTIDTQTTLRALETQLNSIEASLLNELGNL